MTFLFTSLLVYLTLPYIQIVLIFEERKEGRKKEGKKERKERKKENEKRNKER